MDGADVQAIGAELVEPEQRHFGQQLAFAGNGLAHDHVERADAVGGHHQDAVVAHCVVVAHLATGQQGQGGEAEVCRAVDGLVVMFLAADVRRKNPLA